MTTVNVSFIIKTSILQIWAISSVDDQQMKWLEIFAGLVEGGELSPRPVVTTEGAHLGLFTYQSFREFMRQAGYGAEVDKADLGYRFKG